MRPRTTRVSGRPLAAFATLAEFVEAISGYGPRPAVRAYGRSGTTEISYRDLTAAIDATAFALRARGVGPGDRIGLWAPNSIDWIITYFATVRAGASVVPFDHQGTTTSLAGTFEHADLRFLVTTREHRAELERTVLAHPPTCLLVEQTDPDGVHSTEHSVNSAELPTVGPATLAALLFTSGTTGAPKAVPLTHGNLVSNVRALAAARLIAPENRVLLPLPLHHTYPFTVGLLTSLAAGATVILPSGISGSEILYACQHSKATALLAVPRLCSALWDSVVAGARVRGNTAWIAFRALLELSIAVNRLTRRKVGKQLFRAVHARFGDALELIGCGGAKLDPKLAAALEGLGWTVLTGYGLTETSPVVTFNSHDHARLGSEGSALPGVEVRLAPAEADTPGEILVRGANVFSGYWRNERATHEAFTSDGWFRTGDLGRLDRDGFLYVVGRSKELIVLPDGKKLFPESLEQSYAACPLIEEIGIFEQSGTLTALVVPDEDAVRARGALRELASLREEIEDAAARLPPYQRLGAYRVTRTPLPRTQLGKLRRHLLPRLFAVADQPEAASGSAPATAEDRTLLGTRQGEVWQWLERRFPTHAITLDTSPQLDLAVDSLEWVTLTIELEQRFGVKLDGTTLSGILTLRDLLRAVATAPSGAPARTGPSSPAFEPPGIVLRVVGVCLLAVTRIVVRCLWRVRATGVERLPAGPLLITPNHTSALDPAVLIAALPWSRVRTLYWAGWVGIMHSTALRRVVSRATCVFPVDPNRDLATAVDLAGSLLQRGHSVVWFPEGRRSPTGKINEFQPGAGLVLQKSGATAVPTAIRGTFTAWPKHRRFPRLGRVHVHFGAPLALAPTDSPALASAALERAVRTLVDDADRALNSSQPSRC